MGFEMAQNIRKKMPGTATLLVNDINGSACEKFAQEFGSLGRIEIVDSAKVAAENAEVVISIVPDASDVRKVYLDQTNGVIAARPDDNRLILECSTIDSKSAIEVGEKLRRAGRGVYIDTPVSVSQTTSLMSLLTA